MQDNEMAKLMARITEGLGVIDSALGEGFAKVTIKTRLPNSFARKETKTKRVWRWLHQIEAYMETQHLQTDKE